MRRHHFIPICLGLAGILLIGGPALGQTLEQRGFEPVEQLVDDLDPLTRSLRQIPTGLREQAGQESLVYRRPGAENPERLYYIEPGVVAEFDRSEYFVIRREEDEVFQLIPPDTVFHIGFPPDTDPRAQPDGPDHPLRIDARQDSRLAARPAPAAAPTDGSDDRDAAGWEAYSRMLASQRRSVINAIDRALAEDDGHGLGPQGNRPR